MTNHPDQIDREEAINKLIDDQPEITETELEEQYQLYLKEQAVQQPTFVESLVAIKRLYQEVG